MAKVAKCACTVAPMNTDKNAELGEAVAAVLRGERAAQRITFDELAVRSDLDKSTVLRMLNNQRDMKMAQFSALCGALGVSSVDVMAAAEDRVKRAGPA